MRVASRFKILIAVGVIVVALLVVANVFGYQYSQMTGIGLTLSSPVVLIAVGLAAVWILFGNIDGGD
jgi:protein-S-isoprenylcysteine O-methyltransferase Ste14